MKVQAMHAVQSSDVRCHKKVLELHLTVRVVSFFVKKVNGEIGESIVEHLCLRHTHFEGCNPCWSQRCVSLRRAGVDVWPEIKARAVSNHDGRG